MLVFYTIVYNCVHASQDSAWWQVLVPPETPQLSWVGPISSGTPPPFILYAGTMLGCGQVGFPGSLPPLLEVRCGQTLEQMLGCGLVG